MHATSPRPTPTHLHGIRLDQPLPREAARPLATARRPAPPPAATGPRPSLLQRFIAWIAPRWSPLVRREVREGLRATDRAVSVLLAACEAREAGEGLGEPDLSGPLQALGEAARRASGRARDVDGATRAVILARLRPQLAALPAPQLLRLLDRLQSSRPATAHAQALHQQVTGAVHTAVAADPAAARHLFDALAGRAWPECLAVVEATCGETLDRAMAPAAIAPPTPAPTAAVGQRFHDLLRRLAARLAPTPLPGAREPRMARTLFLAAWATELDTAPPATAARRALGLTLFLGHLPTPELCRLATCAEGEDLGQGSAIPPVFGALGARGTAIDARFDREADELERRLSQGRVDDAAIAPLAASLRAGREAYDEMLAHVPEYQPNPAVENAAQRLRAALERAASTPALDALKRALAPARGAVRTA